MAAFFAMGGYAGYVWPAYGVAVLILGAMLAASVVGARARRTELSLLEQLRPRRRRDHPEDPMPALGRESGNIES